MSNNIKVQAVSIDKIPALQNVARDFNQYKAAQEVYKQTRDRAAQQIHDIVAKTPPETPILNRDLAVAAGVTPLHMATILRSYFDIRTTSVDVTRRFIEIGEDGQPIPGAKVVEKTSSLMAYYGRR